MTAQTPANAPIDSAESIRRFVAEIGGEQLGLAHHRPERWAKPTCCIENVQKKVERDGGDGIFGWTFHDRFAEGVGHYLFATHHAVWHSPDDGSLIDVTPFHEDRKHHPFTQKGSVLFLVHRSALPVQRGKIIASLPLKFFAVTQSEEMRAYIAQLTSAEAEKCEEILEQARSW